MISRKSSSLLAAALALSIGAGPAASFDLDGKRVELIVPFGEGGGTDVYARFIGPLLHEKLPGDSTLVIRNIPGAGSIAGANQFEQRAEPDGLTLLAVSTSTLLNYVLDDARVKYSPSAWEVIAVAPLGNVAYVHTKTGAKGASPADIDTLRKEGVIMGANGPTSADLPWLLAFDMLEVPMKPVFGLNRGNSRLALERGEFTASNDNTATYRKNVIPLIEGGIAVGLMTQGYVGAGGKMVDDAATPELPSFPQVYESVYGKAPSGPGYDAYLTLLNTSVMASKALVLPKGTPREIVEVYRDAMRAVVADPTWPERSEAFSGGYPVLIGDEASERLVSATVMDPAAKAWLYEWLEAKYEVKR